MAQQPKNKFLPFQKQDLLLIVSAAAALCLFLSEYKLGILIVCGIFALTAFTLLLDRNSRQPHPLRADVLVLCAAFLLTGFFTFRHTWHAVPIVAAIASLAGITPSLLVTVLAALGCAVGSYAFYRLAFLFQEILCAFLNCEASGPVAPGFRKNWPVLLCAIAFFLLEADPDPFDPYSFLIAIALCLVAIIRYRPLEHSHSDSLALKLLSFAGSIGICWFRQSDFQLLEYPMIFGWVLAICAFPFVYLCMAAVYRFLWEKLFRNVFSDTPRWELLLYGLLTAVLMIFVTTTFLKSTFFYGTGPTYDHIYTSDSPLIVFNNAYLNLTYSQNDLRQPLFAVFAAPFVAPFYLLTRLLNLAPGWNAAMLNWPQLVVLVFTVYLLASSMELTGWKRALFLLFALSCYPVLLFSIMMEQYIFGFFWLILALYQYHRQESDSLFVWGATGSLLTSAVLLPLLSRKHPVKAFPDWYRDMLKAGLGFVVMLLIFGRLDIILTAPEALGSLNRFSDAPLTLLDKVSQYLTFVCSTLWAPSAGPMANMLDMPSWKQAAVTGPSRLGLLILLLCGLSALLTRKQFMSRMAALWIGYSFLILVGLGWGTQENGLILYALYFGWAFWVLLYQLVRKVAARVPVLLPVLILPLTALLLWMNCREVARILDFAISHYPL